MTVGIVFVMLVFRHLTNQTVTMPNKDFDLDTHMDVSWAREMKERNWSCDRRS